MPVPITSNSIQVEVYRVSGVRGCTPSSTPSPNHFMYTAANCRVDEDWEVQAATPHDHTMNGKKSGNGEIYYLPYEDNKIYSMVLPANPPLGCRKFLTANLSGCRFYVDYIQGSNDIIVYHANTKQFGAALGSPANSQSDQASAILDGLHTTAKNDYRALNPQVVAIDNRALIKYDYMMLGENETLRKRNQGRTATVLMPNPVTNINTPTSGQPVSFMGGTTVCGFFTGQRWEFYYQTWGYVDYDRPGYVRSLLTLHWNTVHKRRTEGKKSSEVAKVVGWEQFV